jgi:uncharacterized protein (TIGR00251 family)
LAKTQCYLNASGSGCIITIEASPSATRTEVTGINEWRGALQVRIAAQPRDGAANEELMEFLAKRLSVPRSSVKLLKGGRTSHKTIFVPLSVDKVRSLLGGT